MKASTKQLTVIITLVAAALAANSAMAGGFSFGGGGGGGGGGGKGGSISFGGHKSGVKLSFGGGNHHDKYFNDHHHHKFHHHHDYYYHRPVQRYYAAPVLVYDRCYHPPFRYCVVYPGDSWLSICQRTYGCTYLWRHIATYNSLPSNARLVVGQQLMLPVVNADGTLAASNAPAPDTFSAAARQPAAQLAQPVAAPQPATEPTLPSVAVGSTLKFSGESLGTEKGTVRLLIGELAMPLEVTEWDAASVKIQLPKIDLAGPMKAELEVLRADGSLVSKSAIKLTPADTRVALGN